MPTCHLHSLFGEMSHVFCPFSNWTLWGFFLLLLSLGSSVYILDTSSLPGEQRLLLLVFSHIPTAIKPSLQ